MRLEKLDLYGFKSFADKTKFVFEPGLTAFVGPNGCGKSNVVDAVRWVLGEQRARALRGNDMADVIFKGNTEGRRSLGVAEVTVTLSNEDRALPIEYDQVAITRRLYRSGDSEYLINQQNCRLRDVRELLMDTGIGMDAYSIVEQGKIDLILQSNPKDRRAIFEEAAGISKYNAKRRAAASKLERVEQNLLRLGDTIEEVNKRLRSIRRQASAARRYKEYSESLGKLRLAKSLHDYHLLLGKKAASEAAISASEDQASGLNATLDRLEAERTRLETESVGNDQRMSEVETRAAGIRSQIETIEQAIRLNRERIQDAHEAEARTNAEIRQAAARLEATQRTIADSEERARRLETEHAELEAAIGEARDSLNSLSKRCTDVARRIDEMRMKLLDSVRQRATQQNELSALRSECRGVQGHVDRLRRRIAEIGRVTEQVAANHGLTAERIRTLEKEIEAARARFAMRAEERGELRAQIEALSEQIAQGNNALSAKRTRRDLLEDLEARFEGVELGTQTLLERQADGQCLLGMVADLLQVEPQYALAIEAALGGSVQHLVADTLDSAAEAVSHLKTVDGGRTTLLPLDRLVGRGRNGTEGLEHPGILGHALDLVRFDQGYQRAVEHLLGDTVVVRDLPTAIEIARGTDHDVRVATLDGDVVHSSGPVSGGSEHDRTGILSRKNELRTVADDLAQLEAQVERLQAQRDSFINESGVLDVELEETRQGLNDLNLELATAREHESRLAERLKSLEDEAFVSQSEIEELEAVLGQRRTRMDELTADIEALDRQEDDLKGRMDAVERERQAAQQERDAVEARVSELAVRRARVASEREHLVTLLDRYERDVADVKALQEQGAAELEALAARRESAASEIRAKEGEIQGLIERKDALQGERVAAENRRAELLEHLAAARDEAQTARTALREEEQETQALRLSLSEQQMRIADLIEKVREEHRQELAQLHESYEEPEIDWSELSGEMAELKRKLDGMGTVNLLAIEEQAELETRSEFLSFQEQDLLKAKRSLQEVIRKVNRRSRQLFEQTFATIRENFQELYRKLFGGGRADIILEPDVDVLEAGVEIVAKPPGKEASSIRLLSGGEKSLTAVALLLAIFKSKPSPFCILDEVDAALDDSNIGRFVGLLQEFLKGSQFIIITHSKHTMSVADVLYGITMQEPGVSTNVAVRLDSGGDMAAA